MSGPFKGVVAPHSGIGPDHYSQLLGIYEYCLTPIIEDVIARGPKTIVDVGSHWGYYAIGLAVKCPDTRVIAYDIDPSRIALLRKYATLNNKGNYLSSRMHVRGECSPEKLNHDLAENAFNFMIMDVEGAEFYLLDPEKTPAFVNAEILVELHENEVEGITKTLMARFEATHTYKHIFPYEADLNNYLRGPLAHPRLRSTVMRMTSEAREAVTTWLYLKPKV